MTNENDSSSPTTNPQGQPPRQPPVTPPAPLQGALPDNGKRNADDTRNEADELAREFRAAEKWVIGTNIVLAVIGIFALCIYYGQLRVMRGQLGEIIRQYPELQKSAQAASDAVRLAQDTAKDNERSFRLQQRPYILAVGIDPAVPPLKEGLNMLQLTMRNIGRTPGLNVVVPCKAFIDGEAVLGVKPIELSHGTIGDQPVTAAMPLTLNSATVKGVLAGTVRLEIRGEIKYADIFTDSHVTQFCGFYNVQRSLFSVCATGNNIR